MTTHQNSRHLHPRDALRSRLALDVMRGARLTLASIKNGYLSGLSDESLHKTFQRDRAALKAEGIHLAEKLTGTEKSWGLDRTRSLADLSQLSDTDARAIATLLHIISADPSTPDPSVLGFATARIGRTVGSDVVVHKPSGSSEVLTAIAEGLQTRQPCELVYQAIDDARPTRRVLQTFGIFELSNSVYAVGMRERAGHKNALRTLNLSRAVRARVRHDLPHYEIPLDFDVREYRLLPFEIGDDPTITATLYVPRDAVAMFRERARKRGAVATRQKGALEWSVDVSNLDALVSWTIEVGCIPLAPDALVEAWRSLLGKALGDVCS